MEEIKMRAKRLGKGLFVLLGIIAIFSGGFMTTTANGTVFHIMPLIFLAIALVMAVNYESMKKHKDCLCSFKDNNTENDSKALNLTINGLDTALDVAFSIGLISLVIGLFGLFSLGKLL